MGVLVTRLVLQPALLTALVVVALKLGAFRPPDAMFLLTLLLSNATPTALNMQARGAAAAPRCCTARLWLHVQLLPACPS